MNSMSFLKGALTAILLSSTTILTPEVKADPEVKFYTPDATGCMILRECQEDVKQIFSILDVSSEYDNLEQYYTVADEFNYMLTYLTQVGIGVFLADEKYFTPDTRGLYHTEHNKMFLNKRYMNDPGMLMSVMRHEGWHAAQDCMAGTIDNSIIAIIKPEDEVPLLWQVLVERTYPKHVWPWEKEATWAGKTVDMTQKALRACADPFKLMWEVYEPTPLTRKYLVNEGYLDK